MSDDTKSLGFLEVLMILNALISIATNTYSAIQTVQNNTGINDVKIFGFVVWLILIFIYFKKKAITGKILVGNGHYKFKQPAYTGWIRYTALVGMIAGAVLNSYILLAWVKAEIFPSDKIIILVADFDGPDPQNFQVHQKIFKQLEKATKKYTDVEVHSLHEVITYDQRSLARKRGEDRDASIVLWGSYARTPEMVEVHVHFEVLGGPRSLPVHQKEQTVSAAVAKLDRFEIQTQLSSEMSYLVMLTVGLVRYEAGDYNGAIERFTDALSYGIAPEQMIEPAMIYLYRGLGYGFQNEYDLAAADFNQAIKLKPDFAEAYGNRGVTYHFKGEYDLAIADYNRVIEFKSDDAKAYVNRGNSYNSIGDYDRSITDYDQAIKLKPEFAEAYNNRGNSYNSKGDWDRAIANFDQAINLKPKFAEAYSNRGIVYSYKGEYDLAIADFNKAIELNPNYVLAYNNRGNTYYHKKE